MSLQMKEMSLYLIGTMIEIPRGALTADEVAKHAEFFSFGTNDLTQMTFGFSRDDVGSFVPEYLEKGIFPRDPFEVIDESGVGVTLTSIPVVLDVPATIVTAIDFDNDELLIWVNPDGSDFHVPGGGNSADATRLYTGTTWSTPPSTA